MRKGRWAVAGSSLALLAAALWWLSGPPPGGRASADALSRGRALYITHCQVCHGERGDGRGPSGPSVKAGDLTTGNYRYGGSREALLRTLGRGIPGTAMPSFRRQLSEAQMQDVIAFIRSLVPAERAGG